MKPRFTRRCAACAAGAVLAALAGGCQSYAPRPIDREGHRDAFLRRTPEAPEVGAFAARLAAEDSAEAVTFDPSDGLTLAEGEVVALVYNRELRLARLRAGVAAASAEHAGLWEDPVLGTDIARIVDSTDNPWKVFASVGFTIPISGRLEVEKARAGDERRAAVVRAWAQEWATRVELRRRWVEWSSARERAAVMREFLGRLDQIVAIVERIAEAGEMSRVESRLFQIERATRASELAALEADAVRAELAIKDMLGLAPGASVVLTPSLGVHGAEDRGSGVETEPGEPSDRNAELAVARAEYAVAERTLELEVREQYPDITIGPGYGREDGEDQVLLGISLPLPVLNRNRRGIATATAERELARASYETAYERVVNELARALVARRTAGEQREVLETRVAPLVDQQYADARRIAELGEVDTLVLLESLTRQQETKLRLIEARATESLARIEVDALVGPAAEPPAEPGADKGATR